MQAYQRPGLPLIEQAPGRTLAVTSTVASARSAGLPLIEQPPRSAGLPPLLLVVQSSNDSKRQRHCRTHFDIASKHITQSERARSWSDGSAAQPLSSSASERVTGTRALSVSINWARLVAADDPSFRDPTYQTGPGWTPTITRTVAGARSVEMGSQISNIEQRRTSGLPLVERTPDVHPQCQSLPSTVDDSALRASQRPGLPLMPYRTGPRVDSLTPSPVTSTVASAQSAGLPLLTVGVNVNVGLAIDGNRSISFPTRGRFDSLTSLRNTSYSEFRESIRCTMVSAGASSVTIASGGRATGGGEPRSSSWSWSCL